MIPTDELVYNMWQMQVPRDSLLCVSFSKALGPHAVRSAEEFILIVLMCTWMDPTMYTTEEAQHHRPTTLLDFCLDPCRPLTGSNSLLAGPTALWP